jgi:hypothetical protein
MADEQKESWAYQLGQKNREREKQLISEQILKCTQKTRQLPGLF